MRRPLAITAAVLVLLAAAPLPGAETRLVVVVNPDSGVASISLDEARNLFLGRQKRLGSGLPAMPVEQDAPADIRARFYHRLAHKDLAEINAYWARLFFTGQARPPRQAASAEAVIRAVAADPGAIGLLEWTRPDRRVKVVLALDEP
jgi:ABC-type phosphate transport system substrate-binding protein